MICWLDRLVAWWPCSRLDVQWPGTPTRARRLWLRHLCPKGHHRWRSGHYIGPRRYCLECPLIEDITEEQYQQTRKAHPLERTLW